ncbi:ABC transporter permease [Treponema phagedenis]|uniref:ABC transporter permease n=1 Tax=Treponema phagedenis TaxID=162 RepID=UPI0011E7FBC1|nr:ABC transporter permease [Treponema phagedenis]QEK01548.1 ABC transporter permease [Treponema phagedenis]
MKAFLRYTFITIKNNVISFLFLNLGLTLLMVGIFGFMNADENKPKSEANSSIIKITDEDKSLLSQRLVAVLSSDNLKELIKINEKEKADFTIIIPKGYQTSAETNKDLHIDIVCSKNSSSFKSEIIASVVKNIANSIITNYTINQTVEDVLKSNTDDGSELKLKQARLEAELGKPLADFKFESIENNLSSYAFFSITFIIFIFFTFIMAPIHQSYKKENLGMEIRLNSMPLKPEKLFTASVLSISVQVFIIITAYFLIFRIAHISFTQNPILLLLYAISFSFLCGSVANFLVLFSNKEFIYGITMIVFMVFGVLSNVFDASLTEKYKILSLLFKDFNITNILSRPLMDIALQNSFLGMAKNFFILSGFALAIYLAGICIAKYKKDKI